MKRIDFRNLRSPIFERRRRSCLKLSTYGSAAYFARVFSGDTGCFPDVYRTSADPSDIGSLDSDVNGRPSRTSAAPCQRLNSGLTGRGDTLTEIFPD